MKDWIKKNRHLPRPVFFSKLKRKLTGHYNYYYVNGNSRAVWGFYDKTIVQTYKWLNRRSQRKSYTWEKLRKVIKLLRIPVPRFKENKRLRRMALC